MKIGIIDYGCGNIFSLECSLNAIGAQSEKVSDAGDLHKFDKLILPGVGAFKGAMDLLTESGMAQAIKAAAADGVPVLGICLGMQLLFGKSYEFGEHSGLGLIEGSVVPLAGSIPKTLKIPHMGWNALDIVRGDGIFEYCQSGDAVYFVHSYYAECDARFVTATACHGIAVTAAVRDKNVFGTQFHPEKSGEVGLKILRAFTEL